MKYYRFMSEDEFNKLINGETLVNHNPHVKCRTTSIGFCFLREDSVANGCGTYGMSEEIWHYMASNEVQAAREMIWNTPGSNDVFVVFESSKEMKQSYGVYADGFSDGWDDFVRINEYCTEEYNNKEMVPIRAWRKIEGHEYEQFNFICIESNYWEEKYEELGL